MADKVYWFRYEFQSGNIKGNDYVVPVFVSDELYERFYHTSSSQAPVTGSFNDSELIEIANTITDVFKTTDWQVNNAVAIGTNGKIPTGDYHSRVKQFVFPAAREFEYEPWNGHSYISSYAYPSGDFSGQGQYYSGSYNAVFGVGASGPQRADAGVPFCTHWGVDLHAMCVAVFKSSSINETGVVIGREGIALNIYVQHGAGNITNLSMFAPAKASMSIPVGVQLIGGKILDSDPFSPGGVSEDGGGGGSFDRPSDDINIPDIPTVGSEQTGFVSLFAPMQSELQSLSSYLWSDAFSLDSFKKIIADPMDVIIGMAMLPFNISRNNSQVIKIGNISTDVSMSRASSQFTKIDCGSVTISEYWGAYLDYSPFTSVEIYLPYIGFRKLDTDEVMGKTISVVYNVDNLTGACCAMIKCGSSVLYSFAGECATQIPITGVDWSGLYSSVLQAVSTITSASEATKNIPQSVISGTASTISATMGMKPAVQRSGHLGGSVGRLGVQTPYVVITYPRQCLPLSQNKFTGYPSFTTLQLTEVVGYTEVEEIHLSVPTATLEEKREIERLLHEGVIF